MDYKKYPKNDDIKFAIAVLEKELNERKTALKQGHWLNPQIEGLKEDISCIESAIGKIREKWSTK